MVTTPGLCTLLIRLAAITKIPSSTCEMPLSINISLQYAFILRDISATQHLTVSMAHVCPRVCGWVCVYTSEYFQIKEG